jgi:hypothetical protein
MKTGPVTALLIATTLAAALPAVGEVAREDLIWARTATGPITLDGVLDEAEWAQAESMTIQWEQDAGIPGSGWKVEAGQFVPSDPTSATLKFLVIGNELYLGAVVSDSSVGGSVEFNRFDGLLMAIKNHADPGAPKPPAEYFYSWWYPDSTVTGPDPQPAGRSPGFVGIWAEWPPGSPRTPVQIANWDAVTVVDGLSNDDTTIDESYTVEMRFNVAAMGYNVTQSGGDIIEWNISIYDSDWFWPFDGPKFTTNRVWWQSPWGNAAWYSEVRIHANPTVTTTSGPVPDVGPELVIAQVDGSPPTIDGDPSEAIWSDPTVHTFDIRFDDDALRQTYEAVGPYRAGQFQPAIVGSLLAFVVDPGDAEVKIFHQGDFLYFGFDVNDLVVQHHTSFDRWDGFLITLNEYDLRGNDNQLMSRRISFQVDADGSALPQDYLATLIGQGDAQVAIELKPGTVVDTLGMVPDTGYTAELEIDLKGLGYPAGLGDGRLFVGVNLLDGDSFIPTTDSYGTRTWWYREYEDECCPVWAYLAPSPVGVHEVAGVASNDAWARSYPNPGRRATIQFSVPHSSRVHFEVFDVAGRLVESRAVGVLDPGVRELSFRGNGKAAGVYLYRLKLLDPQSGVLRTSLNGKTVLLK